MSDSENGREKPAALSLLASERPRNVGWLQAAGLLFGDWGTSRLYVLGLAFLFAGRTSFYLILLMSLLIVAVGWAYTQICRIYPDGGGVYTAAKSRSRTLAVIGALLLFADYTVTASLSVLDGFHYFGLPLQKHVQNEEARAAADTGKSIKVQDAGDHVEANREQKHVRLKALPAGVESSPIFHKLLKYDPLTHHLTFTGKSMVVFEREMTIEERDQLIGLSPDPVYQSSIQTLYESTQEPPGDKLLAWDSPGLWAIIAIAVIGLFNLLGPKHTGAFAIFAALGMVFITLLISVSAIFSGKIAWSELPHRIGSLDHSTAHLWVAFVSIVLALSGVEAIANLTGVMKKPVAHTARKAIWVVALEVAIFNILLAIFMVAIFPMDREQHVNDMLAFLSGQYVGAWGEWGVRIVGGLLLLSAGNTAITDMISVQYLMARDGELPQFMVALNRFGVPWIPAIVAAGVPILVLIISHDLESLAALYAIGVIGAVAINVSLCAFHPRLRRMHRKAPMILLGAFLLIIWVTLAFTKLHALVFVIIVMAVGLSARGITKWWSNRKGTRPSLLRQAIMEQLSPEAMVRPKLLLGTYGSESLAAASIAEAERNQATLVVCFIRQVALSYKYEKRMNIDNDLAALKTFAKFLELGHEMGVPILPVYDTGPDAAVLMAENAAIYGCQKVLIGTSRQGALYHLIKGHFQRRLETLLPPEIPVQVISPLPIHEEPAQEGKPQAAGH
ncbi:MAG: amino acid permease [Phycisphaerales bacterium]|jgi:amino acid transporter|nr:amino acid permease [Phycisphaerales bacterium]